MNWVQALDRIAGTMGDARPENKQRGRLLLGGQPLSAVADRRYCSSPNRREKERSGPWSLGCFGLIVIDKSSQIAMDI